LTRAQKRNILYVGELWSKRIWVYDLEAQAGGGGLGAHGEEQAEVGHWYGLDSGCLDDFTLTPDGSWLAPPLASVRGVTRAAGLLAPTGGTARWFSSPRTRPPRLASTSLWCGGSST
jgi:hypothetical protein